MPKAESPFKPEDKERIDEILKQITQVKKDIARAKLAGIDVAQYEQRITDAETKLQNIKRVYFAQ